MTHSPTPHVTAAEAVMLELFGREPIAFHRVYVDITKSVTAALWLSNAVAKFQSYLSMNHKRGLSGRELNTRKSYHLDQINGEFQFRLSYVELQMDTGLTHSEGRTCLKKLIALGLVKEVHGNSKPALYALQLQAMTDMLVAHSRSNLQRPTPSIADLQDDRVFTVSLKRPTPPAKRKTKPTEPASVSAA